MAEETQKREFRDVPDGKYLCKFAKCEFGTSKKGRPQLATWFRIMEGEFEGQYLFYYQATNNEVGAKIANDVFRKSQEHGVGPENSTAFEVRVKSREGKNGGTFRNYYINDDKAVW